MRVCFFNVYAGSTSYNQTIHLVLADLMIRSVRTTMPGVEIVQLTDMASPKIMGVDAVRRLPSEPADILRTRHLTQCEGDWLYLDTDIMVQQDMRHVFDQPFDVAVTDREGTLLDGEEDIDFIKDSPHNMGVVFTRSPAFWTAVLEKLLLMTPARQAWMGIQLGACEVIAEGRFTTRVLPGLQYNYAAQHGKDRCEEAKIAHYKGPARKRMMLQRFMEDAYVGAG